MKAEVGVIVVAESEDICEEALRQLDVEWGVLPYIVDIMEGRKPDAPVIKPGWQCPPWGPGRQPP